MKFHFFFVSLNFVHGSTSSWINCCMILISQNTFSAVYVILSFKFLVIRQDAYFSLMMLSNKGSCAHSTESQTLSAGVCSKVRVCLQGSSKGIKFWIERLIINSVRRFGFRGLGFNDSN